MSLTDSRHATELVPDTEPDKVSVPGPFVREVKRLQNPKEVQTPSAEA